MQMLVCTRVLFEKFSLCDGHIFQRNFLYVMGYFSEFPVDLSKMGHFLKQLYISTKWSCFYVRWSQFLGGKCLYITIIRVGFSKMSVYNYYKGMVFRDIFCT